MQSAGFSVIPCPLLLSSVAPHLRQFIEGTEGLECVLHCTLSQATSGCSSSAAGPWLRSRACLWLHLHLPGGPLSEAFRECEGWARPSPHLFPAYFSLAQQVLLVPESKNTGAVRFRSFASRGNCLRIYP